MALAIAPPNTDEYADFHAGYIAAVAHENDAVPALERQQRLIDALRRLDHAEASHRYAPGKWSVREVIGHLSDTERVMSYRLLRVARGDTTPLPGFDENLVAANSNADRRDLADLVDELAAIRVATLALVRSLDETAVAQRGVVNNWTLSARALVYVIAGHFQHHVNVLRERYGLHL
jgi:uncharacterized damage-inducible protein DinB